MDEYTTIGDVDNGGVTHYGMNSFEYRNLKISFGCGDNTTFIRTYQAGRVQKSGWSTTYAAGKAIAVALLSKTVSSLPTGSTLTSVVNTINSMSSSSGNVTLGSTGVTLSNRKTVAVGEKLSGYSIHECTDQSSDNAGHYFTYQAVLQYESAGGNTSTTGALTVSFDKYYGGDMTSQTITKNFSLSYTSQA